MGRAVLIVDNQEEQASFRFDECVRPLLREPFETDVVTYASHAEEKLRTRPFSLVIVESILHKTPDAFASGNVQDLACPASVVIPSLVRLRPDVRIVVVSHNRSGISDEEKQRLAALPNVVGVFGWLKTEANATAVAKLISEAPGDGPIALSFTMTRELRAQAMSQATRRLLPGLWLSGILAGCGVLFGGRWVLSKTILAGAPVSHQLGVSGAMALLLLGWLWYSMRRAARAGDLEDQKTLMRFTPLCIEKTTNSLDVRLAWEAFSCFWQTKEFFFLTYRKQGTVHIVEPIPKSAFPGPETENALRVLLSQKLGPATPARGSSRRTWIILGVLLATLMAIWVLRPTPARVKTASIEDFVREKDRDNVAEVWITRDGELFVTLHEPVEGHRRFWVPLPTRMQKDPAELDLLLEGIPPSRIRNEGSR